jgi:hypothetical protein
VPDAVVEAPVVELLLVTLGRDELSEYGDSAEIEADERTGECTSPGKEDGNDDFKGEMNR